MEEHGPKRLLDQVRDAIRLKHYSYRTEQAYVGWIKRYIYFHDVRHPSEMGAPEVEAFLTHLAVKENAAASTQNQALGALLFLYREVLHQELSPVDVLRAKRPKRLPTVLTKDETFGYIFHFCYYFLDLCVPPTPQVDFEQYVADFNDLNPGLPPLVILAITL